jgi:hypothetical protein
MKILEIYRGHVKVQVGKKSATVYGEALMRIKSGNDIDYVLYTNSIKNWDAPDEGEKISEANEKKIVDFIKKDFAARNNKLEIE